MLKPSLKICTKKSFIALLLYLGCLCAQAQPNNLPEFLERFLTVQPVKTGDQTTIQSRFDYAIDDTIITRSELKFNDKGNEDHLTLGLIQDFGVLQTQVLYNVHDLNYSDKSEEYSDVIFGLKLGVIDIKHKREEKQHVSSIALPFDLYATEVDIVFDQTVKSETDETIASYKIESKNPFMNVKALWTNTEDYNQSDIVTEYRLDDCCLLKYAYLNKGLELQRQISSQYRFLRYQITGEINSYQGGSQADYRISAITLEKVTRVATLKMRLEYNDDLGDSSISLQFKSTDIF